MRSHAQAASPPAETRPITGPDHVAMTHIAFHESLHGKAVDWMEKVTDEDHGAA
ncbi:hypothetical protein [Rhizobium sp. BK008]|uniref:hypothetical protein n=1 Tax=Rhizobium TaxID=379 RepID=UPI00180A6B1B|nr:aromatic ring-cleaving dioxygenase [Rhizobium sp. BK008]